LLFVLRGDVSSHASPPLKLFTPYALRCYAMAPASQRWTLRHHCATLLSLPVPFSLALMLTQERLDLFELVFVYPIDAAGRCDLSLGHPSSRHQAVNGFPYFFFPALHRVLREPPAEHPLYRVLRIRMFGQVVEDVPDHPTAPCDLIFRADLLPKDNANSMPWTMFALID